MSFQYTYDAHGKPVGVFIPINEWEILKEELQKTKKPSKGVNKKTSVLAGIKKGLQQVNQIEKGKLKAISIKQLLNEL